MSSARVNIEPQAWGDIRFGVLARLCGLTDHDHALAKCARLWGWQTEHYTPQRPTYVVDGLLIESIFARSDAPAMLVRAQLAEAVPEGFRIRGSIGRIEWLFHTRAHGRAGSEAAKRKRSNKEGPTGNPAGTPPAEQNAPTIDVTAQTDVAPCVTKATKKSRAGTQPGTQEGTQQGAPVGTPLIQRSGSKISDLSLAHARGSLAEHTWKRLSELRVLIASELELDVLPLPAITPGHHPGAFRDLQQRIREEGDNAAKVCERVLEALTAQARDTRSIEWLSEKAFTEGGWRTAREAIPGWRNAREGPKNRAAPIGSATPRTDHPESTTLIPIRDL